MSIPRIASACSRASARSFAHLIPPALLVDRVCGGPPRSSGLRSHGIMPAPMAIPKQISFVTFDVYGTLIDWETGAYDAFKKEAERDGFTIERDELIPLFHEIQQQIQAG